MDPVVFCVFGEGGGGDVVVGEDDASGLNEAVERKEMR